MKNTKKKDISREEFISNLSKSMYKAVRRYLNDKDDAQDIVNDILDDNFEAEVDPDEVKDGKKVNITNKNENNSLKSLKKNEKGIIKLKNYLSSRNRK